MMEETTTWRGHSVTLFIFAGLVLLCSIFFILGMLVGRTQAEKNANIAALEAALPAETKPAADAKPDLTFFDSVERNAKPALEVDAAPATVDAAPSAPAPPKRETRLPAAPQSVLNYQIGAYRTQSDAE